MKKRLSFFVACATATTLILHSSAAHADPISYQGTLNDGQPETDTIGVGDQGDPVTGRYWTFFGNQGDEVTITVRRLETALDPSLFIYEGTFADTDQFDPFGDGASLFLGPGLLCFGDDEIPVPEGPFGDPQCVVTLTLPGTGQYTAVVSQGVSDPPGPDGVYAYEITLGDTIPPEVTCSLDVTSLWPPNHELVDVGFSATAVDDQDPDPSVEVQVFSDEDDLVVADDADLVFPDELDMVFSGELDLVFSDEELAGGAGNHSPDAKDDGATLRLRSERKGNGDGRTYLIVVTATDAAGSVGFDCCSLVVPHSQSNKARTAALDQAALAEAYCLEFGEVPPGFVLVGDGPEVGPKQ